MAILVKYNLLCPSSGIEMYRDNVYIIDLKYFNSNLILMICLMIGLVRL